MEGMEEPGSLDLRDRARRFAAVEGETFDLAVIGGGITGAGIARDGAIRGLKVALVEARDFASGTSSRSSKLIHGGLRYLAQGDIGLVREAASERAIVQAIAPNLARETPFIVPARNAAALAKLKAGLWTFEKLGGVPKSRRHEVWSAAVLAEREPAVATSDLAGAVVYPEYVTDDARLTLANIRSAVAHGATCLNYAAAARLVFEGGRVAGLEVEETLPGAPEQRALLKARTVVNAAGPWVDAVRALEEGGATPRLSLTRGVHLVVPHDRLPIARTVILQGPDRRGVFAVPHGAVAYIGTTDTFHPAAETWPPVTQEDVAYLLAAANARFRGPPLTPDDIVSAWSGVRPLVAQEGKSPSDISRKDELWTGPGGVLSIAGGKLTAYRRMAERVTDEVERTLGRRPSPCRTAEEPLIGGDAASDPAAIGVPAAQAERAVRVEGALTLEDYWSRRSGRAFFDADGGIGALAEAAAAMAPLLGWSEARREAEIAHCRALHAAVMAEIRAPQPA